MLQWHDREPYWLCYLVAVSVILLGSTPAIALLFDPERDPQGAFRLKRPPVLATEEPSPHAVPLEF
jgi:hypothetical protein